MRRAPFTLLALVVFAFISALATAGERVLIGREGKGFAERIDGQLVLHLEGTPREMGLQHGKLLREQVRETLKAYLDDFALGERKHTTEELIALWKKHEPHVPAAIVEELDGLAEGAGVTPERVRMAHVVPTVYHCSGAAVSGPATKDGKLYHYRSLDYALTLGSSKTLQENACLIVREPAGGVPHAVVGWAGIVGAVTGMNAAGVSIGEMGSGGKDEEQGAGTPMMMHLLDVLGSAKGGEDAVERFRKWKRGEGYNFIVGDGKTGKAWAIEVTKSRIAVFGMGDEAENHAPHFAMPNVVRRVNHFVSPELAATQRAAYDPRLDEGSAASYLGYALISNFIRERYGKLDGEGMIALCRSYPPKHPCLHQAVMSPGDGRIWVANAVNPTTTDLAGAQNQRFYAYDLDDLVASDPAGITAAPKPSTGGGGGGAAASDAGEVAGKVKATRLDLSGVADEGLKADLAAFDPATAGGTGEFEWTMRRVRDAKQGGEVYDVTFPTPLPSPAEENNTVYCRYYAPQGVPAGAKVPAAIVLHHLGGDFSIEAMLADYLAKQGIAAIEVEFPYYGPRRPKDRKAFNQGLMQADFDAGRAATRQAVADVRRAVDWLHARPEIDAERVGIVGISLGGIVGSLAAGVDGRLKRNVFVIAGGDLTSILLTESNETRKVRQALKERGISRDEVARQVAPIDPLRFANRINREGTLMINAKADEIIPRSCTERLWEASGKPEIVWYESGHATIAVYVMDLFARVRQHMAKPAASAASGGDVY